MPSCYNKNQISSLKPTKIVFFYEVHVKQASRPPTTIQLDKYNVVFPRNEEGRVGAKGGVYETNNKPKRETFKYEQEGQFCLGVAKV